MTEGSTPWKVPLRDVRQRAHLSVPSCCSKKEGRAPPGLSTDLIAGDLLRDPGSRLDEQTHAVRIAAASRQRQGRALAVVSVCDECSPVEQQLQHLCMALQCRQQDPKLWLTGRSCVALTGHTWRFCSSHDFADQTMTVSDAHLCMPAYPL